MMQYNNFKMMKCLRLIVILMLSGCASTPKPENPARSKPGKPSITHTSGKVIANITLRMAGTPYQYGGTSPAGFDCSGLVWYSHKKAGIRVPRTAAEQFRAGRKVSRREIQPGDLLFFRISRSNPLHVSTYIGKGLFVHAPSSGKKVMTGKLESPYWKKRLIGVRRFY